MTHTPTPMSDVEISFAAEIYVSGWLHAAMKLSGFIERTNPLPTVFDLQAYFTSFAVAMYNLGQGARMLRDRVPATRAEIDPVLANFDALLVDLKDVRDMIAHGEDYAIGAGKQQQPGVPKEKRQPDLALAAEHTIQVEGVGGALALVISGKRIPVGTFMAAGWPLYQAVFRAGLALRA